MGDHNKEKPPNFLEDVATDPVARTNFLKQLFGITHPPAGEPVPAPDQEPVKRSSQTAPPNMEEDAP